jgi:radical SAM protein with 4Fe4S-binding SPASM domain
LSKRGWQDEYLRLNPRVALKNLEQPYLYHIENDELYELNDKGRDFLLACDGSARGGDLAADGKFVSFCLKEGLLERLPEPDRIANRPGNGQAPSLRYLEIQLTRRCNLACRHCYLGAARPEEIALEDALAVTREFEEMGGLRLLISGGEPLLYPHLREFIEQTDGLRIRRVLLTNGTLINAGNAPWLRVEEIQFSLDGWQRGHDMLRGSGAFEKALEGVRAARGEGIPVSIATMIHGGNLREFDRLRRFSEEIEAREWGIDILCMAGSLEANRDLTVPYEAAAPLLDYAFGGGYHGSSDGFACGRHLMTVTPTGKAIKCGFYEDKPLGDARLGLRPCWQGLAHVPLAALECKGCPVVNDCAGGCRFRADHPLGPDRAMCAFYGIDPEKMKKKRTQGRISP